MRQTVLKYGFIAGGILSALLTVTVAVPTMLGIEPSLPLGMVIGYTTMLVSFLFIHFGIRSYRDTVLDGSVRFWQAARVGLLIALIGAICYAATWQVVYRTFLPDFAEKYGQAAVIAAEKRGASAAEIEKTRSEMAEFAVMYRNPLYNFGITLLEPAPVGILVALISARILSRRRREPLSTLGTALS
ncbi:MAG: DUF4199 domain-containing protein [Gemmatimonadaceae bacterium]|nr:DUF4199 domain-containing protein [Gemmatimonadaceae bacterium]